jgi:serine/threonine-protein phosphatase 5
VSCYSQKNAEDLKNEGNKLMAVPETIPQAIHCYSQAIELNPTAIYYSNRAQAYIRVEQYGLACNDGAAAITLDPGYAKGYYRRGSANVALGRCEEALKDFKEVVSRFPKNKDARMQMKACSEMVRKQKLAEAVAGGQSQSIVDVLREKKMIGRMAVEGEYEGPHLPGICSRSYTS